MLKKYLCAALLCGITAAAQAQTAEERIARLEAQVARLTEQVNRLLAERLPPAPPEQAVHVCRISAFTDTFRSEHASRGRARLDVLKQCRAKHAEMFCTPQKVQCEAYR